MASDRWRSEQEEQQEEEEEGWAFFSNRDWPHEGSSHTLHEWGGENDLVSSPVVGCQIDIFHFRLKTTKTARLFVLTAAGIPAAVNHS